MSTVDNQTHKACFCDGSCIGSGICGFKWYGPGLTEPRQETITTGALLTGKELGLYKNLGEKLRHLSETSEERKQKTFREAAQKTFNELAPRLEAAAMDGKTSYKIEDHELSHDADDYIGYLDKIVTKEGLLLTDYPRAARSTKPLLVIRWDIPEGKV